MWQLEQIFGILYSCYISSNISPDKCDLFLQELGDSLKKQEGEVPLSSQGTLMPSTAHGALEKKMVGAELS